MPAANHHNLCSCMPQAIARQLPHLLIAVLQDKHKTIITKCSVPMQFSSAQMEVVLVASNVPQQQGPHMHMLQPSSEHGRQGLVGAAPRDTGQGADKLYNMTCNNKQPHHVPSVHQCCAFHMSGGCPACYWYVACLHVTMSAVYNTKLVEPHVYQHAQYRRHGLNSHSPGCTTADPSL
jgi:hypothetical protein